MEIEIYYSGRWSLPLYYSNNLIHIAKRRLWFLLYCTGHVHNNTHMILYQKGLNNTFHMFCH